MAPPIVLERSRRIDGPPRRAWTIFVGRIWKAGAGFGPRPTIVKPGDEDGIGCTRRIGLGFGNGLIERIEEGEAPRWLRYRVMNPGWRTYPVRRHRGVVRFEPLASRHAHVDPPSVAAPTNDGASAATRVHWTVEADPLLGAGFLVRGMTVLVMERYLSELARVAARDDQAAVRREEAAVEHEDAPSPHDEPATPKDGR